ncbi:MAG: response regulator [Thermosynechococcaceae cyanobacterium]
MTNADRIRSIFDSDISQTLDRLEILLSNPETPEFETALKTQVAALLSWGEVLGIEELVSLAQATVMLIRAAPEHNPLVAQLALQGFRAIYRLQVFQAQQPLAGAMIAPAPTIPARESDTELLLEQRLTTTNLFIWQMEGMIFVLPSKQVIEILISKPEQFVQVGAEKCLRWREQTIPVYQLVLIPTNQPFPTLELKSSVGSPLKSGTILVIDQGTYRLALDIDIKLLITELELVILPYGSETKPPPYCHGYTLRSGTEAVPVVNILTLVAQKSGQSRQTIAPAPPSVAVPAVAAPSLPAKSASVVLVVDDSHTLRHILSITLESAGYRVLQAQDGVEALEQLQRHRDIQVVVCDVEMPNMNGFDFLSHCRRDPQMINLPIVMLSTYSGEEHRQLSSTLGANAYFSKPYDQKEFLEKLNTLIG